VDIETKENEVGIFTRAVGAKSTITIRREAAQITHQAWHNGPDGTQQVGRKRGWYNNAVTALEAAQAKLDAAEAEPINQETGEVRDTTPERLEVARLQSVVEKHRRELQAAEVKLEALRIAKDKAAEELAVEEFLRGPLEAAARALVTAHEAFKELANSPYGAEHCIPWLNDELVTAWTAAKNRRCNPPARLERGPTETVEFLQNYSAGTVGGGMFVPGDRAAWAPELCSELVLQGIAKWVTPSPEGDRLVAEARRRLAQRKPYDSETPRVDVGWSNV
jgi:hypothetical protein